MREHLEEIQATLIRRAMEQAGGTKLKAAQLLGMKNYQTLDFTDNALSCTIARDSVAVDTVLTVKTSRRLPFIHSNHQYDATHLCTELQ